MGTNRYILFNKPYGVLCQFTDEGTGHPTLKKYIPVQEVYAAGRLDLDSEGLLILTNDGRLIKHLTDPKHHLPKRYFVMVEGNPDEEKINRLRIGIDLKGYQTLPCQVFQIDPPMLPERSKPVTPHGPTSWLEMVLYEGKKRQIRRMTAAVGLFTLRLYRWAIGNVTIEGLKPGEWRELKSGETKMLWQDS